MGAILVTEALSAAAHRFKKRFTGSVVMGDFNEAPDLMIRSGAIRKLPHPKSPSYPHLILTFCLDSNINSVYILNAEEFSALEPALQLFAEYGVEIQFVKNDL